MRLELSKKTDLALRALDRLAGSGGHSPGPSLADRIGTSTNFLPQILKPLIDRGWVEGVPGPGGGYALLVPLSAVSVLDIVEAVEGKTDENKCVLRGVPCPAVEPCALHASWVRARAALLAELRGTSLESALRHSGPNGREPSIGTVRVGEASLSE